MSQIQKEYAGDNDSYKKPIPGIDDKLRQVLHDRRYQNETKQFYWDVIDENIQYIKKVFRDAGYVDTRHVQFQGFTVENLMTGQEWYDRFKTELEKQVIHSDTDEVIDMLSVARRAANLTDKETDQ